MRPRFAALALVLAAFAVPATAAPAASPLLANPTGKTVVRKLFKGNDISIAVVSSKGTSVFLNPRYTTVVPDLAGITQARLLDGTFVAAVKPATLLAVTPGVVTAKDVKLTAIPASQDDVPLKSPPDYVILLVEVDGLRIAYFCGTFQRRFTPEQLAALGRVDVALIGVGFGSFGVPLASEAYALARSVSPKIILPLSPHYTDYDMALDDIADAGGKVETLNDPLVLDKSGLEDAPERVVNLVATITADLSYDPKKGGPSTRPDVDGR